MKEVEEPIFDVVLIGGGIMSATLGIFLKELNPNCSIEIYERLSAVALESSNAWNNAGTGHSALCELNYTPEKEDGSIDISKAIKIIESFEVSKQFWAYLCKQKHISNPRNFIHSIPHMSLVWGEDNINFLKKRFEALNACHLFEGMEYSDNNKQLKQWIPLVMAKRDPTQKLAATHIAIGTDVNFGTLTEMLLKHVDEDCPNVNVHLQHEVRDIVKQADGTWLVKVKDEVTGERKSVKAKFVFIGAGGGALHLLEKSKIEEAKGFAGFPVSGQWLICKNKKVIQKHNAKVYGKAAIGAPPMSVPHLDTRVIDGDKALLFGPFAGFSTKFLKEGSFLDLPLSIAPHNILSLVGVGLHNISLTKYLIEQVSMSMEERMDALREFVPDAKTEDWVLANAGQRVQVIKRDADEGGVLEFGTEIVASKDGSIAALLGASPGASTAVSIMLDVLSKCYPKEMKSAVWQNKLKQMIPSYGKRLSEDKQLTKQIRNWSHQLLSLTD
ncbi:MAG: malate dehydrogenase (quinone) [Chitinophagales bacterium]|nr:malate dehydrogenase (quinone) [Chitinophagales bacterium]